MKIKPVNISGKYRTGGLCSSVTPEEIAEALGFEANVDDDPDKVTQSWGFQCMGMDCGIWDYKGNRWSTYGPAIVFEFLFPGKVTTLRTLADVRKPSVDEWLKWAAADGNFQQGKGDAHGK